MTEKEKFWSEYDRLFYITDEYQKELIPKIGDVKADYARIELERKYRKRAMSKRWAAYEEMEAEALAQNNLTERIKKLAILEHLNEHDAYICRPDYMQKDLRELIGLFNKTCEFERMIDEEYETYLKDSNDEMETQSLLIGYYQPYLKKRDYLAKSIEESWFADKEYKTFMVGRDKNGNAVFWICRYLDKEKKKRVYSVAFPYLPFAKYICQFDSLREQLKPEEIAAGKAYYEHIERFMDYSKL